MHAHRYWGKNFEKLLRIKKKWDPRGVFQCHHCVGSEMVSSEHPGQSGLTGELLKVHDGTSLCGCVDER